MSEAIHILSLGAGVQSSTMALMAAAGELTPMPHSAIFADTKVEPPSVYSWLDWLEKKLPFPLHRISRGDLFEASLNVRVSAKGNSYTKHAVPAFIVNASGKVGLMMRQCTTDFKIEIIRRKELELCGKTGSVIQWIGISLDEIMRCKPSRHRRIENRHPLIEKRITRSDCLKWMAAHGFPKPPRSACSFCPYHSDAEWKRLKSAEPEAFAQAVAYEARLQSTMKKVSGFRGIPFLHRSLRAISEVDFDEPSAQMSFDGFTNECEGMCGV